MATIVLNWTPAGGSNSTAQLVQRKTASGSFSTIATLSSSATTYTDTTASDNTVYFYQVVTQCTIGGPVDTADVEAVKITCPAATVTVTDNSVDIALPALTDSRSYGTITLRQGSTVIATQTLNTASASTATFTGLTYSTTYNYILVVAAGSFTQNCTGDVVIGAAPTCASATGLSATVS